jgi:hypothetical protein
MSSTCRLVECHDLHQSLSNPDVSDMSARQKSRITASKRSCANRTALGKAALERRLISPGASGPLLLCYFSSRPNGAAANIRFRDAFQVISTALRSSTAGWLLSGCCFGCHKSTPADRWQSATVQYTLGQSRRVVWQNEPTDSDKATVDGKKADAKREYYILSSDRACSTVIQHSAQRAPFPAAVACRLIGYP